MILADTQPRHRRKRISTIFKVCALYIATLITMLAIEEARKIIEEYLDSIALFGDKHTFLVVENRLDILEVVFYTDTNTIDFSFLLDQQNRISYLINLRLGGKIQGTGFGRTLVETYESICKKLEIKTIVINDNRNPSFWKHMDYKLMSPFNIFRFKCKFKTTFQFIYGWPRHKILV